MAATYGGDFGDKTQRTAHKNGLPRFTATSQTFGLTSPLLRSSMPFNLLSRLADDDHLTP